MPEARDRRSSPLDVAAIYSRRPASLLGALDFDPLILGSTPSPATPGATGSVVFGAPRNSIGRGRSRGRGRYSYTAAGENTPPLGTLRRGRGRGSSRSILPSWYPRTPLRDITAVVRAIERRRALLGENEGQQTGTPLRADQQLPAPSVSDAQPQHGESVSSLKSVGVVIKTPAGSKVPKILVQISNQEEGESELLTPQKKLLNNIDKVEKVVREELQRLKRTPSAKKAEREKRVRTLMSMR
ncbi:protein POLYCHOME-like [Gastrolobium bilobum]|uniref:protein POLYCHOME-like n=1 Tax=Gastrolobium bilobum TaxID=150636 RepID=UPI002AB031DF|nr:protein POLYCHOME-like [Gastrolobium bilobum]